jgi:DNA-binding NarL/FixJ family response regulator
MSEQNSETLRILIADDHEIVRQGVKNLIENEQDMTVCGEAMDGREAVTLSANTKPDIAVLDLSMPGLNGIEACRQMIKDNPDLAVLIFTMHDAEQLIREVFAAGAKGYLLKSDAGRHLIGAIRCLAAGSHYYSPLLSDVIFQGFLNNTPSQRTPASTSTVLPTGREREIIQLLAEGKSNKEVASILGISVKTAETHRAAVMRKLGFHSISDLVRYAIRNHIIEA